ncbi:hypothetical protein [Arthrobacter sp. 35W]|uniref:hypothetical protein n=1 Tax=Arthrobacter sp. 35W TaxID=1132441 RepID=UPI0012DEEAB9|nr:hypothetical protein [Arthrobacter sp. 35W]
MRWDALFGDMDSQLAAAAALDLEAEVGELVRAEFALLGMADLLRGAVGADIGLTLRGGSHWRGTVSGAADDWVLLSCNLRSVLVPLAAVVAVDGELHRAAKRPGTVRHSLASVLRELARNRVVATVALDTVADDGPGRIRRGVVDSVGADYLVLAQTLDGPGRRHGNFAGHTTIALRAVVSLSSEFWSSE